MPVSLRSRAIAIAAMALLGSRSASSQTDLPSPAARVPAVCQSVAAPTSLGTALPMPVLNYLDTRAASPFVHAFLIGYVADNGDANHWLTKCAHSFLETPLGKPGTLRNFPLSPTTLLRELRYAEQARLRDIEIRAATGDTLKALMAALRTTGSVPHIEAYLSALSAARSRSCSAKSALPCPALAGVIVKLEAAQAAVNASARSAADVSARIEALAQARRNALASRNAAADSVPKDSVATRAAADTMAAMARYLEAGDAASVARTAADAAISAALDAVAAFAIQVPVFFIDSITKLAPPAVREAPRLLVSAPLPQGSLQRVQVVQSSGLVAALTEYVVDQARQELIYLTLARFYGSMSGAPLLQKSFPESFNLMQGLAGNVAPSNVRASAFALVPLNVWRATLTADYQQLPVRMFVASDAVVCQSSVCRTRLDQVRPLALAAQRLLHGDGVLTVLQEVSDSLIRRPHSSVEQQRIGQGITVLGAIASAYHEQGGFVNADVIHQPYVISTSNLLEAPRTQREAFTRVLMLRATANGTADLATVDTGAFFSAIRGATQAVELILTQSQPGDLTPTQASTNFGRALSAFSTATEIAGSLDAAIRPAAAETRLWWTQFGDVIDPLVARNYGLALSRVTILYHRVSDGTMPEGLLRLAALGASLADAQDGDQVKQAFSAVRPAGFGYEAKRYREDRRISLTGFVGLGAGREQLVHGATASTVWPAIPIGMELPLNPVFKGAIGSDASCLLKVCSAGLLVTVLDLGAPLSWRRGSDPSITSTANTGLQQVFAPGAYLDFGLGRTPFSVLAGGQYIPFLRRPTIGGTDLTGSVFRWGVGVGADVTLFKF